MNFEKQNDDKQEQQDNEIKKSLLDFGDLNKKDKEGKESKDINKKLLEDPSFGNNAVKIIKDDIIKKSNSINDPASKEKINKRLKGLDKYAKFGKLDQSQIEELSVIFKSINSLQGTEVKENNIQTEHYKKNDDTNKNDYEKNLIDAVEKLDELLKTNHEEKMNKERLKTIKKNEIATKEEKNKEPPPSIENIFSQKESNEIIPNKN